MGRAVQACAAHFARWGSLQHAKETFNKLGDHAALMALHIESEKWDDAFAMLRQHPQYGDKVGHTVQLEPGFRPFLVSALETGI